MSTVNPVHNAFEASRQPAEGQDSAPPCEGCKAAFVRRRRWQRFCSPACRNDWHHRNSMPTADRLEDLERRVKALEAKA